MSKNKTALAMYRSKFVFFWFMSDSRYINMRKKEKNLYSSFERITIIVQSDQVYRKNYTQGYIFSKLHVPPWVGGGWFLRLWTTNFKFVFKRPFFSWSFWYFLPKNFIYFPLSLFVFPNSENKPMKIVPAPRRHN